MAVRLPDLAGLAVPGGVVEVRVTPRASRDRIVAEEGAVRVYVTAPPEDGRANEAVRRLLAKAMGVPKSALLLERGQTARDKLFRVAP